MKLHVGAARRETAPVLEEAGVLLEQKREVETKQQLLEAFNRHFILSNEELEILTSSGTGVNDGFFSLLNRLKRIHADCQVLLGSENQQLGLEVMEEVSRTLNSAFQKLFRWVQKEFKTLDLENPRVNAPIRRALRVLAERPTLFQDCLDSFAEARERNLSEAFYSALTGASTQTDDRTTKPMEYYAHDPLRFVGDMLAWTHSASVSERESLEVLFISEGDEMAKGIQLGLESEPWVREDGERFDGKKSLESLVNRDLAGVSRALRQRVEQVIKSDEDPVLAFKIANLIDFYRVTFVRLLGTESSLLENLASLQTSAVNQYRTTMQDYSNVLPVDSSVVPSDMAPSDFLIDALERLRELAKTHDSSYDSAEIKEANFQPILASALDPFFKACVERIAPSLAAPSDSIFAINCTLATKSVLVPFEFSAERASELDDILDEQAQKLTDYQHAFFRQTSGLQALLIAMAPLTDSEEDLLALFRLEAFQPQQLADASQVLDDFLPSALMDAAENLKRLRDLATAEDVTSEAAARFCEDFDGVEARLQAADEALDRREDVVNLEGERPGKLREIFPRTSGEIRVLLS